MKKILFIIVLILTFIPLFSQQTKLLTAEKHNEYGLVYSLPITALQIEIVAVKETKIAGPFSKYSNLFTSNDKIIAEDEVNWTIESVNITPYGVPDASNQYLMQLKAGSPTFISVAEDGMLLSINKEVDTPAKDPIDVVKLEGTPVNGKEYLEFVNEDFISAISSYKQAQLLAEEIMEIRDAKLSLTRGTAETMPTDGRQLEIMLQSLENQEKALTNAFTGSLWKERIVKTINFTPENDGKSVLCRLSLTEGLVSANDYSGEPLYININITGQPEVPVDAKGVEKKLPKDAVMYCIPGIAEVSLYLNANNIYEKEFEMSQFGMLFGLNPSMFTDKKDPSYAIFDPSTGAIREIGTLKQ